MNTPIEINKNNNAVYINIFEDKYTNSDTDSDSDTDTCIEINDCPICLCELKKNDKSVITVQCCNNQFHTKCYLECMNIQKIWKKN